MGLVDRKAWGSAIALLVVAAVEPALWLGPLLVAAAVAARGTAAACVAANSALLSLPAAAAIAVLVVAAAAAQVAVLHCARAPPPRLGVHSVAVLNALLR